VSDLDRARHLVELGRHRDAAGILTRVLAANPDDAEALRLMSSACVGLGDLPRALEAARSATAVSPDDPASHLSRWWATHSAGLHGEAAQAAEEAVRLDPTRATGHRALAIALSHRRRRRREARRAGEEAIRLEPYAAASWQALGYALHRPKPGKARDAYLRALALDPHDAVSRQNLAALDTGFAPSRAIQGFADALAMDPTLRVARTNLDKAVGWAATRVVLVCYFGARLVFHEGPSPGALIAYALLIVPFTVWTYVRLPRGVKQSLGLILAPGLTLNKPGLVLLTSGVGLVLTSGVWTAAGGDRLAAGILFVAGALMFAGGCLGVSMAMREHRRAQGR
jgi:tetratricopeptide (TPR) repeat protein